jgi:hypothetical protein
VCAERQNQRVRRNPKRQNDERQNNFSLFCHFLCVLCALCGKKFFAIMPALAPVAPRGAPGQG